MNQQRLITTFKNLAEIDSPTGSEDAIVDYVIRQLSELGSEHVQTDTFGNVIAHFQGTGEPILLTGHLDTVEPGRGVRTHVTDEAIRSQGNTIVGADNKTCVAGILEAICRLKENKVKHRPIEVVFTRSEEVGNYGAVHLDYSLIQAKQGLSFDGDGSPNEIVIASPFYERFDIRIQGKAAHASEPEQAHSIVPFLSRIMSEMQLGHLSEKTIRNIGLIQAGTARNTVMGNLQLQGEVRSFSESELVASIAQTRQLVESLAQEFQLRSNFESVRENPGFEIDTSNHLIQQVAQTLQDCNLEPQFVKEYGCFDANIFFENDISVVNLHGAYRDGHTVGEYVCIDEFVTIPEIICNFVRV